MSKRTKDFQIYFNDYKGWESELKKSKSEASILVVDVHSTWCGPCKAIVPSFQKLFLEHSDDHNIKFCVVDSEKVLSSLAASSDSEKNEEGDLNDDTRRDRYTELLKQAAGKSQPHFLFYSNGIFKRKIAGINTPLIIKTIYQLFEDTGMNEDESMKISEEGYDEKDMVSEEENPSVEDTETVDEAADDMKQEDNAQSNEDTSGEENSPNPENQEDGVNENRSSKNIEDTGDSGSSIQDGKAQNTDATASDDGDSPGAVVEDVKEIQATEERESESSMIENIPESDTQQNQINDVPGEDTEEKEIENVPDDSAEEIQIMDEEETIRTEDAVSAETEQHSPNAEAVLQDPVDEEDANQVENPSQNEENTGE